MRGTMLNIISENYSEKDINLRNKILGHIDALLIDLDDETKFRLKDLLEKKPGLCLAVLKKKIKI